jgi:hypothetical protein
VVVQGGTAPYTYVWKKGTSTVSGQTSATFTKASAVSGDAGFIPAWLLMPMAPLSPLLTAPSPSVNGARETGDKLNVKTES